MINRKKIIVRTTIGLTSIGLILICFLGISQLNAEETIPIIGRKEFADRALKHSEIVDNLEDQAVALSYTLKELKDNTTPLKEIYQYLSRFQELGRIYEDTSETPNHLRYLELTALQLSLLPTGLSEPDALEYDALLTTLNGDLPSMTIEDYIEYKTYLSMFNRFGFDDHKITKAEEYETFIFPIYVVPLSVQEGIEQISNTINPAANNFKSGMYQIYDTLITLNEIYELTNNNYEISKSSYERQQKKFEAGIISKLEVDKGYNTYQIALLNTTIIKRNISNLKMNMNILLGENPSNPFNIESDDFTFIQLEEIEYYLEIAQTKQVDIVNQRNAIKYQEMKLSYIEDFYSKSSDVYNIEKSTLELDNIELKSINTTVIENLYTIYNKLTSLKDEYDYTSQSLDGLIQQYDALSANVNVGFLSASSLEQLSLAILQQSNSKAEIVRDFKNKLNELYNTCGLK